MGVTIPAGVEIIDEKVFAKSGLTEVIFERAPGAVNRGAFGGCEKLVKVIFKSGVPGYYPS